MTAKILAVCSGGGIGDLLAATPAIRALARTFDGPLTVMTTPYAAPVLQGLPEIDGVMPDDGSDSERDLGRTLAAHAFTHGIVFWSTARVAGALRRAGIRIRVGQARRLYSWKYTKRVVVRTELGDVDSHWTDVQMDYARALGASPQPSDYRIDIRPSDENVAEAAAVLAAERIDRPFLVFHAARGIALDRVAWPVRNFASIADALGEAFDAPVVLTGSGEDARIIAQVGEHMSGPHALVAGKTSLMGLAALLSRASTVVALDSGPMHIAAALGVPTVGIFALRTDLPDRWRPLGPRVAVVRPTYPCPSWHRKENCPDFACYSALAPSVVVEAVRGVASAPAGLNTAST